MEGEWRLAALDGRTGPVAPVHRGIARARGSPNNPGSPGREGVGAGAHGRRHRAAGPDSRTAPLPQPLAPGPSDPINGDGAAGTGQLGTAYMLSEHHEGVRVPGWGPEAAPVGITNPRRQGARRAGRRRARMRGRGGLAGRPQPRPALVAAVCYVDRAAPLPCHSACYAHATRRAPRSACCSGWGHRGDARSYASRRACRGPRPSSNPQPHTGSCPAPHSSSHSATRAACTAAAAAARAARPWRGARRGPRRRNRPAASLATARRSRSMLSCSSSCGAKGQGGWEGGAG
jgi:hypothetical protein